MRRIFLSFSGLQMSNKMIPDRDQNSLLLVGIGKLLQNQNSLPSNQEEFAEKNPVAKTHTYKMSLNARITYK
jgi:hypothetical protein